MVLLSFFVFLTGFGSCSAFSASIKTGKPVRYGMVRIREPY